MPTENIETNPGSPHPSTERRLPRLTRHRFGGLLVFGAVFLCISFALRVALLLRVRQDADWSLITLAKTFLVGLAFDITTASCILAPVALLYMLLPDRFFRWRWHRRIALGVLFVTMFMMVFDVVSEWIFWGEFASRFNFVAIDYLIYTTEVVGNIVESYPMVWITLALAAVTGVLFLLVRPFASASFEATSTFKGRLRWGCGFLVVALVCLAALSESDSQVSDNRLNNELAKNGAYSLVCAFRNNVLDYKEFYLTVDSDEAFGLARKLLKTPETRFLSEIPSDLRRQITVPPKERKSNVVLLVVESLSAKFLGSFGNPDGLTPSLDRLAGESMFFTNFYATGTRTTRGLEAIMLSLPPTPGRSLIKRPNNANMFNLGGVLRKQGYRTAFFYGGYGYFDNMNAFFGGNGFRTIDRVDFDDSEITFTNAWGVCDEDLFGRLLKECDRMHDRQEPFFTVTVTTSNHRPYTYPEGKIDLPQGNRPGAVKYCDYAIGAFIEQARTKPWFDNTIFVIVADHCASSAGKVDVEVAKYHIPLLIYAPKLVTPREVTKLGGQIDLGPTLLSIMGMSYESKFFGRNMLADGDGRALLGNYQKVGLLENGVLTLLGPDKKSQAFTVDKTGQSPCQVSPQPLADTIGYYQTAYDVLSNGLQGAE